MTQQCSGPAEHRAVVSIGLLGPLVLEVDGVVVDVARPQVRSVLTALAAAPGRSRSADALLDELWPDTLPVNPRKSLNVVLSRVRGVLGSQAHSLVTEGDGYRLDRVEVDIEGFVGCIDHGRQTSGSQAVAALTEALTMWRGDPLVDATSATTESRRSGLVEHRWFAITRLTELLVEAGDVGRAAAVALPHVEAEPARERLVIACAHALARDGRKSEALRVLQRCALALRNDHGIDPSSSLRIAERAILDGAVELVDATHLSVRASADLFVGRTEELEMLCSIPKGRSLVVVGEAGIGKSGLLWQAQAAWDASGSTYVAVTVPRSPERPLDAVAQICAALMPSAPELAEAFSTTLARVCPELALPAPAVSLTRDALLGNLAEFIGRAAADVTLVVDDAHWLDAGSIEVLRTVIAQATTRVVLAMRSTDDPKLGFLRTGARGIEELQLAPLTESEVTELVAAASLGRSATEESVRIARKSGGNALFVRLLLDCWIEGAGPDADLPTNVLVAVSERLDVLAQRTRESLQVAAVVGHSFGLHTLRQIRPNVDSDLEHARVAGLIHTDPSTDRGQFVHRLVAEACYELLAPGRRVILHDEIGRILEIDRAPAAEFAPHYLQSAELDPHRAVTALIRAAAEFAAGFDWETANLQLESATDLVLRGNIRDTAIEAELTVRRGIVGRALASDRYLDDLIAGAKLAKELGDHALMAVAVTELCGHGRSTGAISVDEQIAVLLEEALALDLPADHRAELCAAGSVLLAVTSQSDRSRALYHEAYALAIELGDVEIEASVLEHAHLGFAHPADFELMQAAGWRLAEIAGSDPGMRWESAFLRFQTSAIVGDPKAVTAAIAEMRELTPRVNKRARDFGMSFSEAAYAQLRGDLDVAEAHATATLEIGLARYPESWAMNLYSLLLISIRRDQGRLGELHGSMDRMIDESPDFLPFRVAAAAAAHAAGDVERAASETEVVWAKGLAALPFDGFWTSFAVLLTGPTVAYGSAAHADQLGAELIPWAGRLSWNGASTGGPVDGALAIIEEARGDSGLAERYRRSAAGLVKRLRSV